MELTDDIAVVSSLLNNFSLTLAQSGGNRGQLPPTIPKLGFDIRPNLMSFHKRCRKG